MPETNETAPRRPRSSERSHRRTPVFFYLAVLFAVAFLMLLLAYFQQERTNRESTDVLRQSVSAVQSIQNLAEDNKNLREELETKDARIAELEQELKNRQVDTDSFTAQTQALQDQLLAMQWFWQIESAYARGGYSTARELIKQFESTELAQHLPVDNTTGTKRFSPAARYQEIYDALY